MTAILFSPLLYLFNLSFPKISSDSIKKYARVYKKALCLQWKDIIQCFVFSKA